MTEVNPRRATRISRGLSQAEAARVAGVSLATWRRWEEDPESVSDASAEVCEVVVRSRPEEGLEAWRQSFTAAWESRPELTVRQAAALQSALDMFILELEGWLQPPSGRHLHDVSPFDLFDLRVMVRVGHNPAWAAMALERFQALVAELDQGILPFDRPGCFFDEVAVAAALEWAEIWWDAEDEEFGGLPRIRSSDVVGDIEGAGGEASGEEVFVLTDDDWGVVGDSFDDAARFLSWQVPLLQGNLQVPWLLDAFPVTHWFDHPLPDPDSVEAQEFRSMLGGLFTGASQDDAS